MRSVISSLRDEMIEGLAQGSIIKIDGLLNMSVSLGGKFDNPDVFITTNDAQLRVNMNPDVAFSNEVLARTHFEKVIVPRKVPFLVAVQSLPHNILNLNPF